MSLLPTITEVQEGVPHIYHIHSLDDYMDTMRGLSQPSCYAYHGSINPQHCRTQSAKMPTRRQAKYPDMMSSSSSSSPLPPPATSASANPGQTLALVAASAESISLNMVPSRSDSRASWWPHQDPLSWLFTRSQGAAAAATASDAVSLV